MRNEFITEIRYICSYHCIRFAGRIPPKIKVKDQDQGLSGRNLREHEMGSKQEEIAHSQLIRFLLSRF